MLICNREMPDVSEPSLPRAGLRISVSLHRKDYSFVLADGDWFYFAGIWWPASRDRPESYAILPTEVNEYVAAYHDRQHGGASARAVNGLAGHDRSENRTTSAIVGRFVCRLAARRSYCAGGIRLLNP